MGLILLTCSKQKAHRVIDQKLNNFPTDFFYFIHMTISNSYIIYKEVGDAKVSLLEFHSKLIHHLLRCEVRKNKLIHPLKIFSSKISKETSYEKSEHMLITGTTQRRCSYFGGE